MFVLAPDGAILERFTQCLIKTPNRDWGYWETEIKPGTQGMGVDQVWIGMDRIFSTREAAKKAKGEPSNA